MIITPFAYMAALGDNLLLDLYPGAAMAYSVRRLSKSYAGYCMKVRRSSDNAVQDIGFSGNVLDTSALTSFIGANSGYVERWYDQSGAGRDLIQTNTTKQPLIVSSGVVNTITGNPALDFNTGASTDMSIGSIYGVFDAFSVLYAGSKAANSSAYIFGGTALASRPALISNFSSLDMETFYDSSAAGRNTISATGMTATDIFLIATSRNNPGNIVARFDGTQVVNIATTTSFSGNFQNLGSSSSANYAGMQVGEWVVYASDESANLSGMQDDQNAYWTKY